MQTTAVVGAGLAGLTAALRLAEAGHAVQVFERYPGPGGLARTFTVGGEPLEVFYHHLFTSDTAYVALASELGLAGDIAWLPSRMGIWTEGRLWDFGTPMSLLRFSPLSLWDKLRFAATTLALQYRQSPAPFEQITAMEWLRRHQGERALRTIWQPLLQQKFADLAEEVAMVWIWGKLRLRGRSRSDSGLGECLGYLHGSFDRLVDALCQRIGELGGQLHLSRAVKRIERSDGDRLCLVCQDGRLQADRVVVAAPITDYLQIAGHLLPEPEHQRLGKLQATAATCMVLELSHSLTPYYWLNIADPDMPFGGLIEHTNFLPTSRYGDRHVLYISKYLLPESPIYSLGKEELLQRYLPALTRINPEFDRSWILDSHLFRADYAQPLVTVGYRKLIPDHRTPVPGLYLASMGQIFPEDRGQNYAVVYGDRVARCVLEDS